MLKTITTKNGKELNYLDGKLISKARAAELQTTASNSAETIDQPSTTGITKTCLFCGEPATHSRLVQLQTIDLCEEDYLTKTTGEIGEQLNARI